MSNRPLISIIVPAYNVEKFLPQCLDSILAQTYQNLEIILINDGSTDTSGNICDIYAQKDKRIRVIHKRNAGVSSARNIGLDVATGEYVGFVDSDDWIDPDMYEYLFGLCQEFHTSIARCQWYARKNHNIVATPLIFSARKWFSQYGVSGSACLALFKKDSIGKLRFNTDITVGEDALFTLQVVLHNSNLICGPIAKYHYRFNQNSAMNSSFNPKELSTFQALAIVHKEIESYDWPEVYKRFELAIPSEAIRLLNKIIKSNYQGPEIGQLLNLLQQHKCTWIFGKEKLFVKLFALMCCINFNLTAKLYRLFLRGTKCLNK